MIPPFAIELEDGAYLYPGSISEWAYYHYSDEIRPANCRFECTKPDVDFRQPPILPY